MNEWMDEWTKNQTMWLHPCLFPQNSSSNIFVEPGCFFFHLIQIRGIVKAVMLFIKLWFHVNHIHMTISCTQSTTDAFHLDLLLISSQWTHCSLSLSACVLQTFFFLFSYKIMFTMLLCFPASLHNTLTPPRLLCQRCGECWLDTSAWLNIIPEFMLSRLSHCAGYYTKLTKHEAEKCAVTLAVLISDGSNPLIPPPKRLWNARNLKEREDMKETSWSVG